MNTSCDLKTHNAPVISLAIFLIRYLSCYSAFLIRKRKLNFSPKHRMSQTAEDLRIENWMDVYLSLPYLHRFELNYITKTICSRPEKVKMIKSMNIYFKLSSIYFHLRKIKGKLKYYFVMLQGHHKGLPSGCTIPIDVLRSKLNP